jgi:hypothetical protein
MTDTQPNKMRRWTTNEENKLLKEIKDKKSLKEMAEAHDRSEGACAIRLKKLAVAMLQSGEETMETICLKTGLTKAEINEQAQISDRVKEKAKRERSPNGAIKTVHPTAVGTIDTIISQLKTLKNSIRT